LQIARRRFRRALRPEILQRVQAHDRHAVLGEDLRDRFVDLRPAAITGDENHQRVGSAPGRGHFDQWELGGYGSCEEERKHRARYKTEFQIFHFATTPRSPPEIKVAKFVKILGRASPPGDAMYIGSQMGSNFSLY